MGRGRSDKVLLNTEQRQKLEAISHNGYAPAKKILHAQVLLMCDEGAGATKKWTDQDLRKFTFEAPFVGANGRSPLLYVVTMRKS